MLILSGGQISFYRALFVFPEDNCGFSSTTLNRTFIKCLWGNLIHYTEYKLQIKFFFVPNLWAGKSALPLGEGRVSLVMECWSQRATSIALCCPMSRAQFLPPFHLGFHRATLIICKRLSPSQVTQNVLMTLSSFIGECAYISLLPFTRCQKLTFEKNSLED